MLVGREVRLQQELERRAELGGHLLGRERDAELGAERVQRRGEPHHGVDQRHVEIEPDHQLLTHAAQRTCAVRLPGGSADAQSLRQGRGERQPRDERRLERVVGVRLALPGGAARPVVRRQLVAPGAVLGVAEAGVDVLPPDLVPAVVRRVAGRLVQRGREWRSPRRRPSASARVRRDGRTSRPCRRSRPSRRPPTPRGPRPRTATPRRAAASREQPSPRPARRCSASRAHSIQWPMVAP